MKQRAIDFRLLGPFSAAVACVGGLLLAVLWTAALHADNAAREHEERVVSTAMAGMTRRLEISIAPRATWDEAVVHLDNRFDHGWAAANLGAIAQSALGVTLTAVMDPDGKILFGVKEGREIPSEALADFAEAATPLVAAARRAESQRGPLSPPSVSGQSITYPIQYSSAEVVAGEPYMLSATLVQPDFGRALPRGPQAPIVIAGRSFDGGNPKVLADRYMLEDLHMVPGDAPQPGDRARVVLRNSGHVPVATLHWKPARPGRHFFYTVAPAICMVILGLAACLFVVMSRGHRVTRRLARSEERLQLALQAAKAGAFEIDRRAQTFWCSPEMEAILGRRMSYEEASQAPWPCIHPDDADSIRSLMAASEVLDEHHVNEMRVIRPDGEARWVRLAMHCGDLGRITGLLLDIDERKRQELALVEAERAALAAAEAKSRFLATVSHEIRTPMNGILGVLHLLKNQSLTQDGGQLLEEALACGQMLTSLIDDVLDFSKIEAGQLELTPLPMDPAVALEGVAKLLRPQCHAKGVYLETTIDRSVGWVSLDPIRLRQALFNLIGNAVKFTTTGGIHVRMMRVGGDLLRFEIADTGVGIPKAVQAAVFEQFHQGDSSTTRRFGGTGLGLSITRRLARLMGGDIDFVSEDGKGSTFWLEVAAPAVEAAPAKQAAPAALDTLQVLVVEDNATNRLVATRLLETMGMAVQTAEDGQEGVEAATHGVFDLILMDVQMPRMDGLEATRLIRALPAPAGLVPIIALTANAMTHQHESYLAAGMNGLVSKPIAPAALLAEIARVSGAGDDEARNEALAS